MTKLTQQEMEQLIIETQHVVKETAFQIFTKEIVKHQKWEDLQQEGMIGLILAAKNVTHETKPTFKAYARLYVRKKLVGYWHKENLILPLPRNQGELAGLMNRTCRNKHGQLLPLQECYTQLPNHSKESVRAVWNVMMGRKVELIEETDNDHLTITIPDEYKMLTVEEAFESREKEQVLKQMMNSLTSLQCEVVELKFGLLTGVPISSRKVASKMGLTLKEVNIIETEALETLRQQTGLQIFLNNEEC